MNRLTRAINKFKAVTASPVGALVGQLESFAGLQGQNILNEVVAAITPVIRKELANSYRASGVNRRTGTLHSVVVDKAIIGATTGGYFVKFGPDAKYAKGKGKVYAVAGTLKYGAVRQPLNKKKGSFYRDLPTGELRRRKEAAGELGDRAKRTLKRAVLQRKITDNPRSKVDAGMKSISAGTISVIPPRKGFFELSPTQQQAIINAALPAIVKALQRRGIPAEAA